VTLDSSERYFEAECFTGERHGPDNRTNTLCAAPPSREVVRNRQPESDRTVPLLALDPDILGRFETDLRSAGVAGEERLSKLVFLAVTSRVLPWGKPTERPVSVIPKGTTSTGKSHATRTTLKFFPSSAYLDLGSMSRRYLFYSEESFEHRFVYIPEWASIKDDEELVALLRVLLSEGRIVHGTVDIDRSARLIRKGGPTGLLMTTTETMVDAELETRCLTIVTDDSTEQTQAVYSVFADLEEEHDAPVDFEPWHDLQEWIASGQRRVVIPFVRALGRLMPASATRLRRDYAALLSLVRTHALLHQAQRETDARGRIVATVDGDYAPIRELVGELIAEGVEASVSSTISSTVHAVLEIVEEGHEYVSPKTLVDKLKVGRSATYDRIRRSLASGFLVNQAGRDERGMRLVVGAPLPGAENFLPQPDEVVRLMSASSSGQTFGSTMRDSGVLNGRPVHPAEDDPEIERLADLARSMQREEL
jgi:hypothetical protein